MSKGLDAFNKFCDSVNICVNSGGIANIDLIAKEQVEKELKEKETQDNYIEMLEDRIDNLETTYSRYKKALEIIKAKGVCLALLDLTAKYTKDNLQEYNKLCLSACDIPLTQKEYDLLKEVLL